jgi:gamma-glutamylputrescine oxidase
VFRLESVVPEPAPQTTPLPNSPVWDDSPWPPLPQLEGEIETDVCVVGLGGSGLSCIQELLTLGQRVVGIDAHDVGAGAAGRNGGFILAGLAAFYHDAVEQHGWERARAIYRLTLQELERFFREYPGIARHTGSLRIASSADELEDCRRQFEAMRADDLPVEPYEGPEGKGLLFPPDGVFNPLQRCRVLAERVRAQGAQLFGASPAVALSGRNVTTPHGQVRCRHVVVAVDGRLEQVLPELQDQVRTARLQMLASTPTDEVHLPRPVYARWGYEYWQQRPNGVITLGGYRDLGGDGEWTETTEPSDEIQEALERFLRERLRVQAPITHRWGASVSYAKTGLPYLGEVRSDVWAFGGYSGTGNVIGAILGRAVAQLVATGQSALAEPFLG